MVKDFVLDTNIPLYDPESLLSFDEHNVILLPPVLEELDKMKGRKDAVGYSAQEFWRLLEKLVDPFHPIVLDDGSTQIKVPLKSGGHLIVNDHPEYRKRYADEYLLYWAKKHNAILVTRDRPLRIRAKMERIQKEDYLKDRVVKLYQGYRELPLPGHMIDSFYRKGYLDAPSDSFPNEVFHMQDELNPKHTALGIHKNGAIVPLRPYPEIKISHKNLEQHIALSLLFDPDISMLTITGGAGTGKTLLSFVAGYTQTRNDFFQSMILARPTTPLGGDELGALPGNLQEKMQPWMSPFIDSFRHLTQKPGEYQTPSQLYESMTEDGSVQIEYIGHMRGRTYYQQFALLDEGQNTTPHIAKTFLSRGGEGSKLIFIGDPSDNQIDSLFLTPHSNGLVFAAERMKPSEHSAHIQFKKGERSPLANDVLRFL